MVDKKKKITVIDNPNEAEILSSESYSFFRAVFTRFRRHKLAILGSCLLAFMVLFAICAPILEWVTGYPRDHVGLDKQMPPFSYAGVAVKINHPDWNDKTKNTPESKPDFWFKFPQGFDKSQEIGSEFAGLAELNTDTFNNPEYKPYYIYNLKPYGNTGSLEPLDFIPITTEDGKPSTKNVGIGEFFVARAFVKRHNLTGQIITYAADFEQVDASFVEAGGEKIQRENDIGPAPIHVFGTDGNGHDILVLLAYGARMSLTIAIIVVLLESIVGIFIGAIAGFYGGFADAAMQRIIELMLGIPMLPLFIVISKFAGNISEAVRFVALIFIMVFFGWQGIARLVRGQFLSLRSQEFTEAARAIGAGPMRIMFRHMLPNVLPLIIVGMTLGIGGIILWESSLSFLGFGFNPITTRTWGGLLNEANKYIMDQPWPAFLAGLMIFVTILSINFMGDGLRDALDPKLKI